MKMMKKFGLLVALALIVTVGGVYATWTYASNDKVTAAETELSLSLASYTLVGGGLDVVDGTGVSLVIDDTDNNHVAQLLTSGTMIVLFDPAENVTDRNIEELEFTVTITQEAKNTTVGIVKYNNKDIFNVQSEGKIVGKTLTKISDQTTDVAGQDLSSHAGKWYFTVTSDEVASIVSLTESFELHNVTDWHTFNTALSSIDLSVSIAATGDANA